MIARAVIAGVMIVALGVGAHGDCFALGPTETLRDFFAEGSRLLKDPALRDDPEAGLSAVRRLTDGLLDVRRAAGQALGREWDQRTVPERAEFVRLFAEVIERAYLAHLVARLHGQDEVRVTYLDESIAGDTATVATTFAAGAAPATSLQYRMARIGDRWTVHDVVVEGVSLVENYRAQFRRVLSRVGFAGLLTELRDKGGPLVIAAAPADAAPPATAAAESIVSTVVVASVASPPVTQAQWTPAPSPPPAASPAPLSAATNNAYWVQIGAFRNLEAARGLTQKLASLPVALSTTAESLWRVRVGPFGDPAAARSVLRQLERQGFRPFVAGSRD